jgi:hypothetical protein
MKHSDIDQVLDGLKNTLKTMAQNSVEGVDFKTVLSKVDEIVKSIPYGAISGDQISGGTIKNFSSSGIKDSATLPILKISDNGIDTHSAKIPNLKGSVTVEENIVSKSITVLEDLTVSGVLRANVDINYADLIKRIPQRTLSGNLINGGSIINFASTGIKDEATGNKILIKDEAVYIDKISVKNIAGSTVIEKDLTAENINVTGVLSANKLEVKELSADIRIERTSPIEFKASAGNPLEGRGMVWSGGGTLKQFVLDTSNRISSTESINLSRDRAFMIDNINILTAQELGPTVRKSRLTELGQLKNLTVLGDVNFDNYLFFDPVAQRFWMGDLQPNGRFSLSANNVELKLDINEQSQAMIGAHGYHDVLLISDNVARVTLHNNGAITLGNKTQSPSQVSVHGKVSIGVNSPDPTVDLHVNGAIKFKNQLQTYSDQAPLNGSYNKGDIVWNTDPKVGQPVGWVCTRTGTPGDWRPFGIIG